MKFLRKGSVVLTCALALFFLTSARMPDGSGPNSLQGSWEGEWKGYDGYVFKLIMNINPDKSGAIYWTLSHTPKPGSFLSDKIGKSAIEHLAPCETGEGCDVKGVSITDFHTIIQTDKYRFRISADGQTLTGETRGNNDAWQGKIIAIRRCGN